MKEKRKEKLIISIDQKDQKGYCKDIQIIYNNDLLPLPAVMFLYPLAFCFVLRISLIFVFRF